MKQTHTSVWAERAEIAARSVVASFDRPARTWRSVALMVRHPSLWSARMAATQWPPQRHQFIFWWQAHYIDALIDAAHRRGLTCDEARDALQLAEATMRGMWVRNRGRWVNDYYDDMAWICLAADRLNTANLVSTDQESAVVQGCIAELLPHLESSITDDMGGGCYWSCVRDFKNAPATGPIALFLARRGDIDTARPLVEWMYTHLRNDNGLIMDGMHWINDAPSLDKPLYTYNQGTVLACLLALGEEQDLKRAVALIDSVANGMRHADAGERHVLLTHGEDDGGLFTGILARYLAVAALDSRLPHTSQNLAATMIYDTAEALWESADRRPIDGRSQLVFSPDPLESATETVPTTTVMQLGPQVQAWTILEAAALLDSAMHS